MTDYSDLPLNPNWWDGKPFHQFQRFAPKLQTMIWNLAIPNPWEVLAATIFYVNYDLEHPKAVLHHPTEARVLANAIYDQKEEFKNEEFPRQQDYRDFVKQLYPSAWYTVELDMDDEALLTLWSNTVPDYDLISFQVIGQILPLMHTCRETRDAVLDIYYLQPRKVATNQWSGKLELRWFSPSLPKPTVEQMEMSNHLERFMEWAADDILYIPPQMDEVRTRMMYRTLTSDEFDCHRVFFNVKQISIYHSAWMFTQSSASVYLNFLGNFESLERVTLYFDPGRVGNKPNGTLIPHKPRNVRITTNKIRDDDPLPSEVARDAKELAMNMFDDGEAEAEDGENGSVMDYVSFDRVDRLVFTCAVLCWKKPKKSQKSSGK